MSGMSEGRSMSRKRLGACVWWNRNKDKKSAMVYWDNIILSLENEANGYEIIKTVNKTVFPQPS